VTTSVRPLQVGVSELLRHPGTRRALVVDVVLDDLALSSAEVVPGTPVHVDLVLESLSSSLTATGTVTVRWQGDCRRCLEPVEGDAEADVHAEVFEPAPTEGETYPLVGEQVDLEPLVRDAVLLALPLAPLCADTCAGPAPETFPTGPAVADDAPGDPRWAALDDLSFGD
jgi:uncharacterized protein